MVDFQNLLGIKLILGIYFNVNLTKGIFGDKNNEKKLTKDAKCF